MTSDHKLFETAFTQATVGMALLSPEGTIIKANPALCNLLGLTREEILGIDFRDVTHPDDLHHDSGVFSDMLEGKISTCQFEKRYIHQSGRIITVILSSTIVRDEHGKPEYFISQYQDITQVKLLEHQAQVNLRKATMWEMSVGVAHEINNPLTIILLNSKVLEERLESDEIPKEELMNFVKKIRHTSERIGNIVSRLKGISRPLPHGMEPEKISLDNLISGNSDR